MKKSAKKVEIATCESESLVLDNHTLRNGFIKVAIFIANDLFMISQAAIIMSLLNFISKEKQWKAQAAVKIASLM